MCYITAFMLLNLISEEKFAMNKTRMDFKKDDDEYKMKITLLNLHSKICWSISIRVRLA